MELSPNNRFVKLHNKIITFAENHSFLFILFTFILIISVFCLIHLVLHLIYVEPETSFLEMMRTMA